MNKVKAKKNCNNKKSPKQPLILKKKKKRILSICSITSLTKVSKWGSQYHLNRNLGPYFHLSQGMLSQNPSPLTLLSFLLSPFLSRSPSPSAQWAEIVELLKRLQILNMRVDRRTFSSQHVALYTKNKIPLLKLIFVLLIYYLKYHNSST